MSTHIVVIDDYHQSLIEEGVASLHVFGEVPEPEQTEEPEAQTKVVRRGRPRKTQATEGAETK